MKPSYCTLCGRPTATQVIDDRPRTVCSACGHILYENPLPVAAAVVLNDRREVLLVKRRNPPHAGEWCLPMGFAELGETIAAAARRELREETGLDGRVLRLLDADSLESSHYGDLLIVTFELQKVGGREQPGDDAADLAYFPISRHPPLAFRSNEKALGACVALHHESWAIQDSFASLQSDEDKSLLSDALVALIQEHAADVARLWLADVRSSRSTQSYATVSPGPLVERACQALSQFGRWLKGREAAGEVKAFYLALAHERQAQGFQLHEVLSSLTLLKKQVWSFARSQGVWQRPIDVYRVLELDRRIAAFFDGALVYTALGYELDSPLDLGPG